MLADALFHEIGHHLDHTGGAPAPSGEAAAEASKAKLFYSCGRKQYWYLMPFLRMVLVPLRDLMRRRAAAGKAG